MATRFYFPSSGTPDVSPPYSSSWDHVLDAESRVSLISSKIGSSFVTSGNIRLHAVAAVSTSLARQFITGPLQAQTIQAGTIKGQIKCSESSVNLNATVAFNVRVCDSSGNITQEVLGIQASDVTSTTPPEIASTLINRSFQNSSESTSIAYPEITIPEGGHLIIELGFRENSITAGLYVNFQYGDNSATDLPENATETGDYCP